MSRICIVSAVYPQDTIRCQQFAESVAQACAATGSRVLLAAEAGYWPTLACDVIGKQADVTVVQSDITFDPPALRALSISASRAAGDNVAIFLDYDDVADSETVLAFARTLSGEDWDFAYSDLGLVTTDGAATQRRLFHGALPEEMSSSLFLQDGNVLGFSNTALRLSVLEDADLVPPKSIVALDWWLYTRLTLRGCKGKRVDAKGAGYRLHSGNTLGDEQDASVAGLLRRLRMMQAHYNAFSSEKWSHSRLVSVKAAIAYLDEVKTLPESAVAKITTGNRVWFHRLLMAARVIEQEVLQ